MAQITIEMVDQIMERFPYVTYKQAKEALIKTDGDVLEAIILIENSEEASAFDGFEKKFTVETEKVRDQLADLLKQATLVRVVVEKDSKIMLNIPLGIGVVGVAVMPIVTLLGLSAAMLSKYSVKIVDANSGQEVDLGNLTPEKVEILKEILFNSFSSMKDTIKPKHESNEEEDTVDDITDELIKESENKNEENTKNEENNK